MGRFVRFVEMKLNLLWMGSRLLPAMNVLSLFVDLAMSMKGEREIKLALNAKPDTSALKVILLSHSLSQLVLFPILLIFVKE